MRRMISCALILCMVLVIPVRADETTKNVETTKQEKVMEIAYDDLANFVKKNNKTIEANKKLLESLRRLDRIEEKRKKIHNSSQDLDYLYGKLNDTSDMLEGTMRPPKISESPSTEANTLEVGEEVEEPETPLPPNPPQPSAGDIAGYASLQANMALANAMQTMLDEIYDLLEVDSEHIDKFELKFDEIEEKLVIGAKKIYIAHEYLQLQLEDLERKLEVLDYNLLLADKKHDVGMMTNNERLNTHQNRKMLISGMETLKLEIETLEGRLGALINIDEKMKMDFTKLSKVTEEDLRFVNYQRDYKNAKANNHTLKQKSKDIGIAKLEKDDSLKSTVLAHESVKLSYDAEVKNFEMAFERVFKEIEEKARLLEEARDYYDMEAENYKLTQLKYDAGIISNLDLTTAQDTLALKDFELQQAEINLFSAVEAYKWALRGTLEAPSNPSK